MAKIGEKEINKNYPAVSGTDADQKHEGRKINLVPKRGTLVRKRLMRGIR